ncbi:hypothetical protein Tco_0369071 [Tanacetum coccineum]
MHNNIMAAGSKDRPPMLRPGRYSQWRSRFLWYIDTKPNGNPATTTSHTTIVFETVFEHDSENKEHFLVIIERTRFKDNCSGNLGSFTSRAWRNQLILNKAQRDKDIAKNLALIARTTTEDTTPRYNNDNQSGQFGNQRTITVAGARETVESQVHGKDSEGLYQKGNTVQQKQPLETVQNNDEINNVFANERQHSKNNTTECADERDALANLIANLTLDTEENKMILKQLKKANASLTHELEECKTNLDETSRALGEATSCRDSCLIALQNKQNELEKYIAFNDRTIDYEILQTKLNDTLGLLALKDIEIKEGLKTKSYEISVLNQKHDELVKKSLLTKSQLEGYLKEKTKVISDLKVKEEKDIDKMIEMDKQLKFLNEIVYTRKVQSIQGPFIMFDSPNART